MTTQEIADKLVALCREGKNTEAINELYADNVVSIEPENTPDVRTEGKEAVLKKTEFFMGSVKELHDAYCSDPLVCADHFSVSMGMDITFKDDNRMKLDEIAVYEVTEGKISKETFFFSVPH